MLVDYEVTEMGSLDDYLDAAPQGKSMRVNGITTFLLYVAQYDSLYFLVFLNSKTQQLISYDDGNQWIHLHIRDKMY